MRKKFLLIFVIVAVTVALGYYSWETGLLHHSQKFIGKITSFNLGCAADGACSINIDDRKVITAIGRSREPWGSVTEDYYNQKNIGKTVEVYAQRIGVKEYTLQGNESYYIRLKNK
jgi:hypothetical protein